MIAAYAVLTGHKKDAPQKDGQKRRSKRHTDMNGGLHMGTFIDRISANLEVLERLTKQYERDTLKKTQEYKEFMNRDYSMYTQEYAANLQRETAQEIQIDINATRNGYQIEARKVIDDICADVQYSPLFTDRTTPIYEKGLAALRIFNEFDIPMTKEDAEAIAGAFENSPLGIRALASVAARSGLTVKGMDTKEVIAACNALINALDQPITSALSQDQTFLSLYQTPGAWQSAGVNKAVAAAAAAAQFNSAMDNLKNAIQKTTAPEVSVNDGKEEEKQEGAKQTTRNLSVTISEQNNAEQIAQQIGIEKATDGLASQVITDHYTI